MMFAIGDTFNPKPIYARDLNLNVDDVYTICKVVGSMVYWNGPGLQDLGGYGDGCSDKNVLIHLTPCNIELENK